MADAVSRYLAAGWNQGEDIVVISRPRSWELIADHLERCGCHVRAAENRHRVHVLDAVLLLRQMRRRGVFMADKARTLLTATVEEVAATGRPFRAFGELVELLAEEGNFALAVVVEGIWNELQARHAFPLFCGYASAHFVDPRHSADLRRICATHTHVAINSADSLGGWLSSR